MPPVLPSAAALLNGLFEHPVGSPTMKLWSLDARSGRRSPQTLCGGVGNVDRVVSE